MTTTGTFTRIGFARAISLAVTSLLMLGGCGIAMQDQPVPLPSGAVPQSVVSSTSTTPQE